MDRLIGVYVPAESPPGVAAMEEWVGRQFDVHHVFTNWDSREGAIEALFDETLASIHAAGRTPLLTWEPYTPTPAETTDRVVHAIGNGAHDEYLDRWGQALGSWLETPQGRPRRLQIRLGHEMNGSWYPWGVGSDAVTPAAYIRMWRHVFDRLEASGVDLARLDRIWSVNHEDVGNVSAEACYPGDDYVDWVAVDGYNWGAVAEWSRWRPPRAVFHEMVGRLRQLTQHPIAITEFGSTSRTDTGYDPARKADWLEAAFEYFDTVDLDMVVGFNVDKETDWAVFGGERGISTTSIDGQSYFVYPSFADGVDRFVSGGSPPRD